MVTPGVQHMSIALEQRPAPFARADRPRGEARCELVWDQDRVIRRFGRVGGELRERVQGFADAQAAHAGLTRQVLKLLDKGYRPGIESEAHLAAIVRAFDDRDVRRGYARWLAERGDDRGRLIALHLAGAEADAASWVARCPGLRSWGRDAVFEVRWQLGFVDEVAHDWSRRHSPDTSRVAVELRRLLAHPSGVLLRRIDLSGLPIAREACPIVAALERSGARSIRSVRLAYLRRPLTWLGVDVDGSAVEKRLRAALPGLERCDIEVSGSAEPAYRRSPAIRLPGPRSSEPRRWWHFWRK